MAPLSAGARALLADPKFIVARGERYMRTLFWMVSKMPREQRVPFITGMLNAINQWLGACERSGTKRVECPRRPPATRRGR